MKGLLFGFVFCAGILLGLLWFFPYPIAGWWDVVYVIVTGLIALAIYLIVKRFIKVITQN
jgi:hypothetical protein